MHNARGNKLTIALLFIMALTFLGCGGGGGGGSLATLVGRVLSVDTGGPTNPQSSVESGSHNTLTNAGDGSFQLPASTGTTSVTVDTNSVATGIWTFLFPPASGVTDIGDLWIGPERVTVRGTLRDSTNGNPVAGASVSFAGRNAVSNASGLFNLLEVAYSSNSQTSFWGIVGSIKATGYFATEFSTAPNTESGGIVNVGDIILTPLSDPNPPPPPFNIWGLITAPGGPQGAIVRLKLGGNDIRVFNVGADGKYMFFVTPGTYTISASKGAATAPDQQVTLNAPNEVIRRDFNLQ